MKYTKYLKHSIQNIPILRWIFVLLLLIGSSFEAYSFLAANGGQPSFYEIVLIQIDKVSPLTLFFVILIILMGIGYNGDKKNQELQDDKKLILGYYLFSAILIFIYVFIFIMANIFTSLLLEGNIYLSNKLNTISYITLSPDIAMLLSILFFYCKFTFITIIILIINTHCKKLPLGYLGGLSICLIDAIVYYNLWIDKSIGIFPFEHTYLESAMGYSSSILINTLINLGYWILLLFIIGMIIKLTNRKVIKEEIDKNETNNM